MRYRISSINAVRILFFTSFLMLLLLLLSAVICYFIFTNNITVLFSVSIHFVLKSMQYFHNIEYAIVYFFLLLFSGVYVRFQKFLSLCIHVSVYFCDWYRKKYARMNKINNFNMKRKYIQKLTEENKKMNHNKCGRFCTIWPLIHSFISAFLFFFFHLRLSCKNLIASTHYKRTRIQ